MPVRRTAAAQRRCRRHRARPAPAATCACSCGPSHFPTSPAPRYAVVLDLPLNELTTLRLREETGISLRGVSLMKRHGRAADAGTAARRDRPSVRARHDRQRARSSRRGWSSSSSPTGSPDAPARPRVSIMLNVARDLRAAVARVGTAASPSASCSCWSSSLVGVLLLIIQFVALLMGLALARSITGSVHELFVGTERVRQGDFSHRIAVLAKDQLGELADSFNSMTAHLSSLLAEMAEKKRLEEELRIARRIQMSLLPQNPPVEFPGVSLTAVCQPAREVGGDYYDFLPLEGNRLGLLIADVAGKGTSAALYMAELKGLMLSLTQIHRSPARPARGGEPHHLGAPGQPQLHHHDLRGARSRRAHDDVGARRAHAAHPPAGCARGRSRRAHPRAGRHGARAAHRRRRALRGGAGGGHHPARPAAISSCSSPTA